MPMSDLYSTREAASHLGVSEASVRRWADAGLIPVQRIGLRGVRRFALADLDRLAEGGPRDPGSASAAAVGPRDGGGGLPAAPAGAQLGLHDHFATFYAADSHRLRVSLPFLRDGPLAGQGCVLVASSDLTEEDLQALPSVPALDVGEALKAGAPVP